MNNLKPIMKETIAVQKPGLLKKKPFGKTAPAAPTVPNLMQRLTGK